MWPRVETCTGACFDFGNNAPSGDQSAIQALRDVEFRGTFAGHSDEHSTEMPQEGRGFGQSLLRAIQASNSHADRILQRLALVQSLPSFKSARHLRALVAALEGGGLDI